MPNRILGLVALAAIVLVLLVPVHAQPPTFTATDRSAYVPGDTGTLTFTISNTGSSPLEIRNVTIYFPWAGYGSDGKFQGNTSIPPYSPYKLLTSSTGGGSTFTDKASFTIPAWYAGALSSRSGQCPDTTNTRYSVQYGSCILVGGGGTGYGLAYVGSVVSVNMALPTYTPVSLVSMTLPIITLVVLVIAVAVLVMVWRGVDRLHRDMKK